MVAGCPEHEEMKISAAVSWPQTPAPAIESLELESPRRGELRVRIVAAGICHTDLHAHSGRLSPLPIVLGHEGAGIVEEVGEGVREFAPGDAVLLSGSSCGVCPNCYDNHPSYCDQAMPRNFGGQRIDGSTALTTADGALHSLAFLRAVVVRHAFRGSGAHGGKARAWSAARKLAPLGCGVITEAGSIDRVAARRRRQLGGDLRRRWGGIERGDGRSPRRRGAHRCDRYEPGAARAGAGARCNRFLRGRYRRSGGSDPRDHGARRELHVQHHDRAGGIHHGHRVSRDAWSRWLRDGAAWQLGPPMFKILAGGRVVRGILGGDAAPRQFIPMLIRYWQQGDLRSTG